MSGSSLGHHLLSMSSATARILRHSRICWKEYGSKSRKMRPWSSLLRACSHRPLNLDANAEPSAYIAVRPEVSELSVQAECMICSSLNSAPEEVVLDGSHVPQPVQPVQQLCKIEALCSVCKQEQKRGGLQNARAAIRGTHLGH